MKTFSLQDSLLSWYDVNKKPLPWRETHAPYAIWVSEVMSQQTQVETVIPYYTRWMEHFPSLEDLAAAAEDEVLKLWEGLGYYSRARNLQAGARQIMADFAGKFPSELADIQSIKGIGPYTAAAIGSIAFNLPAPAVDGNLFRVASRLFEISEDISKAKTRKIFEEKLGEVISRERPGDFNQAMMDLGSRVCKPKEPICEDCPIVNFCLAYAESRQAQFPVKSAKIKQKPVYYQAFVLKNSRGDYLLEQRPDHGLLASMWTFPMLEISKNQDLQMANGWQDKIVRLQELGEIKQVFSHLIWHVRVVDCQLAEDATVADEPVLYNQKWLLEKDFDKTVFPKVQLKMFDLLKRD